MLFPPRGRLVRLVPVLAVVLASAFAASTRAGEKGASYRQAMEMLAAARLGEYVSYIAHDAFEGRLAGSRGGRAVGDYLASELKRLQLKPAGDEGGYLQPFAPNYRNVIGLLEGRDPTLKNEVVVLQAHYDHVGYGTWKTSRGPIGHIHNGADDNASGTTGVLEVAEAMTWLAEPPKRTILFCFFDAEEIGLLGSKHWVAHPSIALERLKLVIDVDMIGRLRDDRLTLLGTRTTFGLRRMLVEQNREQNLLLNFSWKLQPNGDHYPFFEKNIPVLLFHTGEHEDYHRPSDKADRINTAGMQRVARLLFATAWEAAERPSLSGFRAACRSESPVAQTSPGAGQLVDRFGALWDSREGGEGVRLTWVYPGLSADKAGLRAGDRIVEFDGRPIHNSDELTHEIHTAESPAPLVARRFGVTDPLKLAVALAGNPVRMGITWRTDDAEPDTVILTHVAPGSPAAQAGLAVGDRILDVAGQRFDGDARFAELIRVQHGSVTLQVERDGRIQSHEVRLPEVRRRAA